MKKHSKSLVKSMILMLTALSVAISLLAVPVLAEEASDEENDWVTFYLMCNEGMNNDGGNVGNTMMGVSMNEKTGKIKLMMVMWDTFVQYEGYDVPQKLDMAYRNGGPEESLKVFNANFNTNIPLYMSLNYLNLASLVDTYGGIRVDITRAERNALNGMVDSKKRDLEAQEDLNILTQAMLENIADNYYLNEFGEDVQLNGLQAVAYGWLQYDSVYNCCEREVDVVAALFHSLGEAVNQQVVFYEEDMGEPEVTDNRRIMDLDNLSDDDLDFLLRSVKPITDMSYNNLTDDDIKSIALAMARISYEAARQGTNIFDSVEKKIMPLECKDDYQIIAGSKCHVVDYEANGKAMRQFLFDEE